MKSATTREHTTRRTPRLIGGRPRRRRDTSHRVKKLAGVLQLLRSNYSDHHPELQLR